MARELEFNPARAEARVALMSYNDPGEVMCKAILNPSSLPIDISVGVGEMHPVGSSHSTLQYGHTKAVNWPIELYFSNQLQGRVVSSAQGDPKRTRIGAVDITEYVNWLASFCYGREPGHAPSPLLIIWPHVMNIIAVVRRYRAEYVRFARDLAPTAARVSLECAELRMSFKGSDEQRKSGFLMQDPLMSGGGTGSPLKLGKG